MRDDRARLLDISDAIERAIAAMRHALVHAYFRVDLDEVWSAVRNDLPGLKVRVQELLRHE